MKTTVFFCVGLHLEKLGTSLTILLSAVNVVVAAPIAQQAYLKASNTEPADQFGFSVAVSGDTIAVGAIGEYSNATGVNGDQSDNSSASAGAVYVFVRNGVTWSQQAYLKASNTGASDEFGFSVALSGDTLVVGARWEDSSATGVNGDQSDNSATNSGAAYVFVRSGTTWTQQAYLKASNTAAGDLFGKSVGISGDTVVVSSNFEDSAGLALDSGSAYVFVRDGTTWSQQAYLKATNAGIGDRFGYSVAIAGETIVVGALFEDSDATGVNGDQRDNSSVDSGAAYIFVRDGTNWRQQAYLKPSNTGPGDQFGFSVAVSGDTVVVGAEWEDSNATGVNGDGDNDSENKSGAAYVFVRNGTTWRQQAYLKAFNTAALDLFGREVAIAGDTVIVGAMIEDGGATGINGNQSDNSVLDSGAAYVFVRNGATWSQRAYLKASNPGILDQFGVSIAIAGDTVVVGANREDSDATGVNGAEHNNNAIDSGAVYVFSGFAPSTGIAPR